MEFTEERQERYSRHILLKEVGVEGQKKLWNAKVLLVGVGGLGSPVALYLAAAGVGTLGLADGDRVWLSNLQRQVIHHTPDVGRLKVESAAEKIRAMNPDVRLILHPERLVAANAVGIVRRYDFVVDATDSFQSKFLVNDACVLAGVPFSHGGVLRFQGQALTVIPGRSACIRCVFEAPPPADAFLSCSQEGILGAVPGMLGTLQAAETLKYFTGAGRLLTDALLTFDALTMTFRRVPFKKNPRCAVCGEAPTIRALRDDEECKAGSGAGHGREA
jgi:molybdopterin/thiamine biosynthesis adenylyltransferase